MNDFLTYPYATLHFGTGIAHSVKRQAKIWTARVRFPAGARNFLYSTASRPTLGPTQAPIQCVPVSLSRRYSGRSVKLTSFCSKVKNGGAIPPFPYMSTWRGAYLIKRRDNFTLLHSILIYIRTKTLFLFFSQLTSYRYQNHHTPLKLFVCFLYCIIENCVCYFAILVICLPCLSWFMHTDMSQPMRKCEMCHDGLNGWRASVAAPAQYASSWTRAVQIR
jgi:hypothetical protein